jgi:hypothetical protein
MMRNLKMAAIALAALIAAQAAIAAPKTTTASQKAKKEKPVKAEVIILKGSQNGGVDAGLREGLERFIGAPLEVIVVDREAALDNPKYEGLNLDYMPLYLLEKTALTSEKFKEAINAGQLKEHKGQYIVFEKQTKSGVNLKAEKKPNVLELFVMSQCPYGVMAQSRIIEAKKLGRLPDDLIIDVRYIVRADNGNFSSLHGPAEWEENVRQLIVKKYYPKKFWKYLEIRNKDYQSSLWDVAAEKAGINPNVFRKRWKEGLEMLKKEAEYSGASGVGGSPTYLWEGQSSLDQATLGGIPALQGLLTTNASAPKSAPQGSC